MEISLRYYLTTLEGQQTVLEQKPFICEGRVWQGYEGNIADVDERQLTDTELEAAKDVDGTKGRVIAIRNQRLEGRDLMRRKELDQRDAIKRRTELEELQLRELRAKVAKAEGRERYVCDVEGCGAAFDKPQQLTGHKTGAHATKRRAVG